MNGPPASPWQLEVDVWCAPKADPTEHRPALAGRWQRSTSGVLDDMGRHDGTLQNGAEGVPGFLGSAFEFERVNQEWIELDRTIAFYPEGDFTVDAWIQTNNVDPGGGGHVIAELYELGGGIPPASTKRTPRIGGICSSSPMAFSRVACAASPEPSGRSRRAT